MKEFNQGRPFHGSEAIQRGKLTGSTDTDYFYFFCPKCGDTHILQVLDFKVMSEGPVKYEKEKRKKAVKDFKLVFQIYCPKCKLKDFVKISNSNAWQEGCLKDSPAFSSGPLNGRGILADK